MAVEVEKDYMGDGQLGGAAWDFENGYTMTRRYLVTGLGGAQYSREIRAMQWNELPAGGAAHPDPSLGINVIGKTVATLDLDKFVVSIQYGTPKVGEIPPQEGSPAIVSVGTVLVEVETQFDFEGNQIFTEHVDGTRVSGSVRAFLASTEVRYQRHEQNSPGDKSKDHVGSLNDAGVFGDVKRTWLCGELAGHSNNGGLSYMVDYAFIRSPHFIAGVVQPWDPTIVELDPKTGTYVLDPVLGAGKKVVKVQRETNFSALNLTLA